MGRPIKANKWNDLTSTNIDYGYPNDGTTDNDYDTDKPGVVIGDPESRWQIVRSYVCIKVNGLGTITTDSSSITVEGTGTNFTGILIGGAKLYTSAGVFIGVVASVTDDDTLELVDNAEVDVTDSTFYFGDPDSDGIVLRQKGKRKFLVARQDSIDAPYIIAGNTYFINSVSDTDWAALGAGPDAAYGKVFTATANGTGLTTTGTVYYVGVCSLVDTITGSDLEPGEMFISYYDPVEDDTFPASELSNHWLRPWYTTEEQPDATKYVAQLTDSSATPDTATGYTSVDVNDWD